MSYYTGMSKYESAVFSYASSPEDQARCDRSSTWSRPPFGPRDRGVGYRLFHGGPARRIQATWVRGPEGLDPSPACATLASEMHGIPVRTGTAADVAGCHAATAW